MAATLCGAPRHRAQIQSLAAESCVHRGGVLMWDCQLSTSSVTEIQPFPVFEDAKPSQSIFEQTYAVVISGCCMAPVYPGPCPRLNSRGAAKSWISQLVYPHRRWPANLIAEEIRKQRERHFESPALRCAILVRKVSEVFENLVKKADLLHARMRDAFP